MQKDNSKIVGQCEISHPVKPQASLEVGSNLSRNSTTNLRKFTLGSDDEDEDDDAQGGRKSAGPQQNLDFAKGEEGESILPSSIWKTYYINQYGQVCPSLRGITDEEGD